MTRTSRRRRACARLPGARGGDRAEQLPRRARISPSWMAQVRADRGAGVDTRALTRLVRDEGPPDGGHRASPEGEFDLEALREEARGVAGARRDGPRQGGQPAAGRATRSGRGTASGELGEGYGKLAAQRTGRAPHVVAIDYGSKRNILRNLVAAGARVTIVPAERQLRRRDGARARRVFPVERAGRSGGDRRICRAVDPADARDRQADVRHLPRPPDAGAGGRRPDGKMYQGHRGANHPVKRLADGRGRDHQHEPRLRGRAEGLPDNVRETQCRCSTAAIAGSS